MSNEYSIAASRGSGRRRSAQRPKEARAAEAWAIDESGPKEIDPGMKPGGDAFTGAWSPLRVYFFGELADYNGIVYMSLRNSNTAPPTDKRYWRRVISSGLSAFRLSVECLAGLVLRGGGKIPPRVVARALLEGKDIIGQVTAAGVVVRWQKISFDGETTIDLPGFDGRLFIDLTAEDLKSEYSWRIWINDADEAKVKNIIELYRNGNIQ